MPAAGRAAAKQQFIRFLAGKKLRLTSQRQAIIDRVFETREHFTADQLLAWARERDQSVSRATVYRTLGLLAEGGFLREMDFGKGYTFYDPNYADHPHHSHIICAECDKIVEFDSRKMQKLQDQISHKLGFEIKAQRLQITGSCEQMKRLGACKKKEE